MAQIAGSAFLGTIALGLLDRYRAWKRSRPELKVSKDWRGRLVVDRKLKLVERSLLWGWAIFTFVFCPYIVYLEWYT